VNRGAAHAPAPSVTIQVNGRTVAAVPGSNLAAALWDAGWRAFSAHPVTGRPRGPLCGMGACQECLVLVTETAETPARSRLVRSCLEPVRAGLHVRLDLPDGEVGPAAESGATP
jgi:NADH dehydrogenase/NADH:ubiquinone oxidoreductase subunit G